MKVMRIFRMVSAVMAVTGIAACDPQLKLEPIASALTCACPKVMVEGVLQNRSDNYFAGSRFVLKDASGEVDVRSWLPMEIAPFHPSVIEAKRKRGEPLENETMANFLGKQVRLIGKMEALPSGPPILVVEQAHLLGARH